MRAPNLAEQVKAVDIRHHNIEQDEGWHLAPQEVEALHPRARFENVQPCTHKDSLEQMPAHRAVIDDKNRLLLVLHTSSPKPGPNIAVGIGGNQLENLH